MNPVLGTPDLQLPKKELLKKPDISTADWDARKTEFEINAEDALPFIETYTSTNLWEMKKTSERCKR